MDMAKLIERARKVLFSPKSEWPVIAGESATIKGLYTQYILILAALPAVFGFIKGSLIGHGAFGIHVRTPMLAGLASMVVGYVLSLVVLYLVALIINALASRFDARKDLVQAMKVACYAWTAAWIAGIGVIVPGLGWLIALAGGVYSIYLLYLGLPHAMQCPPEKAGGYTAVSVILAVLLSWILGLVVAGITMTGTLGSVGLSGGGGQSGSSSVSFDKDSRLGKLFAIGQNMKEAGEAMQRADSENDAEASGKAMQTMMGALSGSKDGKPVQSLAPAEIKAFLPESLGDLKRKNVSSKRQGGGMGIQISEARADYVGADGSQKVRISLTDMPAAGGLVAMAGAFGGESDSRTEHGYEKTYSSDGRRIHEKWDNRSRSGEFGIMLGNRFQATVKGNAGSMDELKAIISRLDLAGLEHAGEG